MSAVIDLLTLGDELLLGKTPNGHLTFIGETLAGRGAMLRRCVTITDNSEQIVQTLGESLHDADVVITTGGLGPTCDDRTREAVAELLGLRLVFDESVERTLRERFTRMVRVMTENNLKQAWKPEGAEVLPNPNGTAPGLWMEKDGKFVCMLPGPPNELRPMFLDEVLPRLARRGFIESSQNYVQLRTVGIGESMLETRVNEVLKDHECLSLAFCAHPGSVDCRLSGLAMEDLLRLAGRCAELLGEDCFCMGEESLEEVAAGLLRKRNARIAILETNTEGMLTKALSRVNEGSVFAGSLVCPDMESAMRLMKKDSIEDIAKKMSAEFATTHSMVLIREDEGKTVLALATPGTVLQGEWSFLGRGDILIERTVVSAIDYLRRELLKDR